MSSQSDQTVTVPADGPPPPPYVEAPIAPPKQPRVRRTLALPIVAAIAAATLLIGGLAGGIIGYAVHSDGPDNGFRQGGPGQRFQQGGPGNNVPQPPSGQQGSDS
ncbi:hypothetical protein [Nocardioides sp. URHA0020]|uniref:hypothetical protein n=1 Tax=Nocardioides sp. URHA0020 TaxID=1380392 RepID=UPI00048C4044|nr:hypothetical protein [Nocardioides sp. URHA0020]